MFTDKIEITVTAGKGGDGRLGFRHEKYRAMGGPDGGDGGHGGNVVLRVDHNLNTLSAFRRRTKIAADAGGSGGGDRRHGKNGADITLAVPEGTQVFIGGSLAFDLVRDGQTAVVARGGRGGFGNAHFTSSTRQAPRTTELGEPGEDKRLTLELKLVADVGLIGLPNAGKSTLLSVISHAKPAIGDYPFTTLTPNLGVVDIDADSILVADIPGLIEGASKGKGLGDEFLRHIERTAVLVHLVDAHAEDIAQSYATIQRELRDYAVDLTAKPQIVVLTKIDGLDATQLKAQTAALKRVVGGPVLAISATAGQGVEKLLKTVLVPVRNARAERAEAEEAAALPVIDDAGRSDWWQLKPEGKAYALTGAKLEGFARRTNWDNDASVERLRDILRKQGVGKELERLGADDDATIIIAGHSLEWR